jgi:hypothetical protein
LSEYEEVRTVCGVLLVGRWIGSLGWCVLGDVGFWDTTKVWLHSGHCKFCDFVRRERRWHVLLLSVCLLWFVMMLERFILDLGYVRSLTRK